MRNRGLVVAAVVTCLGCFSTASYDRAHSQRVSSINARHDAELEREHQHYISLVIELDKRRAFVIPVKPESAHAPVNRVDERADIVECRRLCGSRKAADIVAPLRALPGAPAQCMRDICQPAYVDALIKTYSHAQIDWVNGQLSASSNADLESLLAYSHNESLLAEIDQQATVLAQQHARARVRLEQQRQRELHASVQLRATEIEAGRVARRTRVKAAADAFAAESGDRSVAPATAARTPGSSTRGPDGTDAAPGCAAGAACAPAAAPPAFVTCLRDPAEAVSQATDPAARRNQVEPSTPIACRDERDCPAGTTCDVAAGVCCTAVLR
jgi:hypothetical protein